MAERSQLNVELDDELSSQLAFTADETRSMLLIWASAEIQEDFKNSKRHTKILDKISSQLHDIGKSDSGHFKFPKRSNKQVKSRFQNQKKLYTKIKSRIKSGASADIAREFLYFNEYDRVLGTKPSITSTYATDSMSPAEPGNDENENVHENEILNLNDDDDEDTISVSVSTSVLPPSKKKKVSSDDWQGKLVNLQSDMYELHSLRAEGEKKMIDAMTNYFLFGAKYYESKLAKND